MAANDTATAPTLLPFWGRVLVMESPVDETERGSGVIVPMVFDGGAEYKRGVVLEIDDLWDGHQGSYKISEQIAPGTVVYYRGGIQIIDVIVLEPAEILCYERIP